MPSASSDCGRSESRLWLSESQFISAISGARPLWQLSSFTWTHPPTTALATSRVTAVPIPSLLLLSQTQGLASFCEVLYNAERSRRATSCQMVMTVTVWFTTALGTVRAPKLSSITVFTQAFATGYGHATRVSAFARHLLSLERRPMVYIVSSAPKQVFADSVAAGGMPFHASQIRGTCYLSESILQECRH